MSKTTTRLAIFLACAGLLALARTATAALVAPTNGTMAQAIAGIDSNLDGAVDRDEWSVAGERTFAALDFDKDGAISRDEFALIHGVTFPVMDTNHDGKISETEAEAYHRLPWTLGLFR